MKIGHFQWILPIKNKKTPSCRRQCNGVIYITRSITLASRMQLTRITKLRRPNMLSIALRREPLCRHFRCKSNDVPYYRHRSVVTQQSATHATVQALTLQKQRRALLPSAFSFHSTSATLAFTTSSNQSTRHTTSVVVARVPRLKGGCSVRRAPSGLSPHYVPPPWRFPPGPPPGRVACIIQLVFERCFAAAKIIRPGKIKTTLTGCFHSSPAFASRDT